MKKLLPLMMICMILFIVLTGCSENVTDDYDKIVYDVTAKLDDGVLYCTQETVVKNVYKDGLDSVVFALYPNAYAEGAEHTAFTVKPTKYGGIDVKKVTLNGQQTDLIYNNDNTYATISFPAINKGEEMTVCFEYEVTLPECSLRFGSKDGYNNVSNFYPQVTVFDGENFRADAFSTNGDPVFSPLADFKVKIDIPSSMTAAVAGESVESIDGERKIINTVLTNARDFAFVAKEGYTSLQKDVDGVTVSYYYVDEEDPQSVLDVAAGAIKIFSDNFGAYPYKTFTVASTPFDEEGMEFSGLVFVSNDSVDKEGTTIHETAHQWFYNMVGSDNINAPYLDEGLTTFCAAYYYALCGDEAKYDEEIASINQAYQRYEKLQRARGENARLSATESIYDYTSYQYTMLIYYKTALMFQNLYDLGGKDKFNESVKLYVNNNRFGTADKDALTSAFNEGMKTDVSGVINGFLTGGTVVATFAS